MNSRNLFGTVVCAISYWRQVPSPHWARTTRRPTACLQAMGKIRRRRFPRRWLTRRRVPAAVMWAAVRRIVVRDGLPRPISSSWTGSAAPIKRSLKECRATDIAFSTPWHRGAQRQRFSTRLRRRTEGRLDSPRR